MLQVITIHVAVPITPTFLMLSLILLNVFLCSPRTLYYARHLVPLTKIAHGGWFLEGVCHWTAPRCDRCLFWLRQEFLVAH